MPRDQEIVGADNLALPFQRGPDLGCMAGCFRIEGQDIEAGCETLDLMPILDGSCRFAGAVQQFGQHDG